MLLAATLVGWTGGDLACLQKGINLKNWLYGCMLQVYQTR